MNYTIGTLTVEKDPSAALKHLIKSAQFETPLEVSFHIRVDRRRL